MNLQALKKWFKREQRDFPWRRNRNPYAVWVSEMMLQQTRASVVIPYFERWMEQFPTIEKLAKAPLEEVIKAWEGLGYYSRARYLYEGAKKIVQQYGNVFPEDPEILSQIKGFGPYTSAAVRSFAFHHRVAAIDGNVERVLARYFLIEEDVSRSSGKTLIVQAANSLMPEEESWIVNEALIELGATICGKIPQCGLCPLKKGCRGYETGKGITLPYKAKKVVVEHIERIVTIVQNKNLFLVRQVPPNEIMAGLYEFPYYQHLNEEVEEKKCRNWIRKTFGIKTSFQNKYPTVKHAFTRFQVRLHPLHFVCEQSAIKEEYFWYSLEQLHALPFSSGHRQILKIVDN